MSYIIFLRQSRWARKYEEDMKSVFGSRDVRYKPKKIDDILSKGSSKKKRSVEVTESEKLSVTISLADENKNSKNALDDEYIVIDEIGEPDKMEPFDLEFAVLQDINEIIEEDEPSPEDKAIQSVKNMLSKIPGPIIQKHRKKPQKDFRYSIYDGQGAYIISMINKLEALVDGQDLYDCNTCGCHHKLAPHAVVRVVVGDSMINWRGNQDIKSNNDEEHVEYLIQSGKRLDELLTTYIDMYGHDPRPQHVVLHAGMNDILQGYTWLDMRKKIAEFQSALKELDDLHDRGGNRASVLYPTTLMTPPEVCQFGPSSYDPSNLSSLPTKGQNIIRFNKFLELRNKELFKEKEEMIPHFNTLGYRTAYDKTGTRFWSKMKNSWRESEGPHPLHPSDKLMKHILSLLTNYVTRMGRRAENKIFIGSPRARLSSIGMQIEQDESLLHKKNEVTFSLEGIRPNDLNQNLQDYLAKSKQEKKGKYSN